MAELQVLLFGVDGISDAGKGPGQAFCSCFGQLKLYGISVASVMHLIVGGSTCKLTCPAAASEG